MKDPITKKLFLLANGSKWFFVYEAILLERHNNKKPSKVSKGKLVGKWLSATDCGKDLEINPKGIRKNLRNGNKTYKGYVFEYEGQSKNLEEVSKFWPKEKNGRPAHRIPKRVTLIETGQIFDSAKQAAEKCNLKYNSIRQGLCKNYRVEKKYTFKYTT